MDPVPYGLGPLLLHLLLCYVMAPGLCPGGLPYQWVVLRSRLGHLLLPWLHEQSPLFRGPRGEFSGIHLATIGVCHTRSLLHTQLSQPFWGVVTCYFPPGTFQLLDVAGRPPVQTQRPAVLSLFWAFGTTS